MNDESLETKVNHYLTMFNVNSNVFAFVLQPKSPELLSLLKEEIEWVKELQELEPDVKCKIFLNLRSITYNVDSYNVHRLHSLINMDIILVMIELISCSS